MFEPIGGSAPKYTGQGVINPLGRAICAGQMMLDFLGETEAAKAIETAVIKVTREKIKSLAAGKMGYTTSQVGDPGGGGAVVEWIHSSKQLLTRRGRGWPRWYSHRLGAGVRLAKSSDAGTISACNTAA